MEKNVNVIVMSKPFHFDTWKFASNCKWCTINYFTIPIGMLIGFMLELGLWSYILGFGIWGIIFILHYFGFIDDDDSDDDDDDKPENLDDDVRTWITIKSKDKNNGRKS